SAPNAPHHRAAERPHDSSRELRFGGSACMWLLGAACASLAAPHSSFRQEFLSALKGRGGTAPQLRLTLPLCVSGRPPVFARLLIQHLTLHITGPPHGIASNHTNCASAAPCACGC